MKKRIILLSLISSLVMTGCSKNSNAINVCYNYDLEITSDSSTFSDYSIEVTAKQVRYLLDGDLSFILLFGSKYCSHCDTVKENLIKYLPNYGYTIYYYDIANEIEIGYANYLAYLNSYDSVNFPSLSEVITPHMFVVSEGKIVSEINQTKLISNYSVFKSAMNSFINSINIYNLTKYESYEKWISENSEYYLYLYNSTSTDSIKGYVNDIASSVFLVDVLAIDLNLADSTLNDYFASYSLNYNYFISE